MSPCLLKNSANKSWHCLVQMSPCLWKNSADKTNIAWYKCLLASQIILLTNHDITWDKCLLAYWIILLTNYNIAWDKCILVYWIIMQTTRWKILGRIDTTFLYAFVSLSTGNRAIVRKLLSCTGPLGLLISKLCIIDLEMGVSPSWVHCRQSIKY